MKAAERRQEILEMLCDERHITMDVLAERFGVSRRTIITDVQELSLNYPIYTVCGKSDGGVYISEEFDLSKHYFTDKQTQVLQSLMTIADEEKKEVLKQILKQFGVQRKRF